jgi:hypothetical protein
MPELLSYSGLPFKATVSQTTALVFSCGGGSSSSASRTFQVNLPPSIGAQNIQDGDAVFIGLESGTYTGSNPVDVNTSLPDGQQEILASVLRPTSPTSITPIGYKLVNLNLNV